jgi:hypothetical protein
MRLPYLLVFILVTALLGASVAHAAGSENVSLLGRFAEGPCLGLEAVDGVAYFGNGAVLEIVVLPAGPTPLGRVALAGPILGVSVAGGLACVANGTAGLRVVDVSDPTQPYQRGVYLSPGCVEEVAIDGTHVYLAAGEAGLRVVDISDPSAPFEAGYVDTPGYTDDVVVAGGVAYVCDGNYLRIIDVANAAAPVEIGFLQLPSIYETTAGLDVAGNLVYLVTLGENSGLRIIDVSAPGVPSQVGFLNTFDDAFDVSVSGGYAYVAAGTASLRVIDVSAPAAPVEIGSGAYGYNIRSVEVSGHRVYATDWRYGLAVFEVLYPPYPMHVSQWATHSISEVVAAAGDFAYLESDRLYVLDVSNPGAPGIEGAFVPTTVAHSMFLDGGYAYVAGGNPDLHVFDLADPGAPLEVGELSVLGSLKPADVAVSGNFAYLPMTGGHTPYGIVIADISDPTAPVWLSSAYTQEPWSIAAGDGFAFVGGYFYVLSIIDATDPLHPHLASTLATTGRVVDVVLNGKYVYLACSDASLRIVDVSDPYAPQEVGFYATPGQALGVCVRDHYAYVADGTAGLRVIDVADPTAPVEVGFYDTYDVATSVYLDNGRIYVADRNDGLYILQHDLPIGTPDGVSPAVTGLHGIYPNPFNPQVSIDFSLAQPQQVRIAVFDLAGSRIAVVADRMFETGTNSISWNGRDTSGRAVPSGTYLVRMEAAGLSEARKVTLLR